ncbi:GNAT family N-acetyltransferase [Umezawaea endophytica]|uniref:GNAT family N-acetyltransferase n=1 Tax=Umezawaea endophytica TaxID=1654476 RepID=A0A9X3A3H8_9PSEU|nr:GNAT family N-acetyltransferase [Umezawaea endophytica]MCS7480208.1 GNAT family N-acetyltransferase [Umezawaea endophytica]
MELCTVTYDHPDAVKLIDGVQKVYVERYGDEDITPVDPAEFSAPHGFFVVGYLDGEPVACGGWRAHDVAESPLRPGDAEIKRMYVVDAARGKGLARRVLAELERAAREAGRTRMVLETGSIQPEAIALYLSSGYERMPNFGSYRDDPLSLCFGKALVPTAE